MESEEDALWHPHERETDAQLAARAAAVCAWLEERPETHVALVGHSSWLNLLFQHSLGSCSAESAVAMRRWFANGEARLLLFCYSFANRGC